MHNEMYFCAAIFPIEKMNQVNTKLLQIEKEIVRDVARGDEH